MKPFAVVFTIIVCATLSAAGAAALAVRVMAPAGLETGPEPAMPAAGRPAEPDGEVAALRGEVQMLAQRIVDLEREVSMFRDQVSRRPVPTPVQPAGAPRSNAAPGASFSEEERAAIVRILEDAREQELAQREEERLQREEDLLLARAGRIATEVGLSAADQKVLTDHMLVAAVKRREILDLARQDGFDRERMRDQFLELRDWSERTLVDTFGAGLAAEIQDVERSTRGGDRFFGRGGQDPGREGGGRGQGNTGGGRGGRG